ELLYGKKEPQFDSQIEKYEVTELNEEQNEILNLAISAQDYFLIQGPPGTGKTSKMLRYMLEYFYEHTKKVIVLLAFTNRATDEIAHNVRKVCGNNFIRLGNLYEGEEFYEASLKAAGGLEQLKHTVSNNRIFVSTVASFYGHLRIFEELKTPDILIVDEASQLLEPHLCGILPKFKKFILIGDEKQLPAVLAQPHKFAIKEDKLLNEAGIKDLSLSLFERLLLNAEEKGWKQVSRMLSVQFRTHKDIANFISREFYKTLEVGSARQSEAFTRFKAESKDPYERFLASGRVLFQPILREKYHKFHNAEAAQVAALLCTIKNVYGSDFEANRTVGVITPYRAQIAQIRQHLNGQDWAKSVTIDTVERFQGSERDIIIISMASNYTNQLQFLQAFNTDESVDKKLNVALSRAREQLILIGCEDILQKGKFYAKFLAYCENAQNSKKK
ncbi:MAG: AAA family ATPase, partial [Bernardetiaceae bacterium]|nr:AAA family ATPase [Bernardetiaceae bacterium]